MKKIALVGYKGRMGTLINAELQKYYEVIGIGRDNDLNNIKKIDLVIDFASHESSVKSAEYCLKNNIPIMIGSTGQTVEEYKKLEDISNHIKMIRKANFSKGIEILKDFIKAVLNLKPQRFEIIEKHHKNKKDSPSGTALELESFIKKSYDGDIQVKSIREGEEMGEHEIVAYVGSERLSAKHNVYSRSAFVCGVVEEVKNILN